MDKEPTEPEYNTEKNTLKMHAVGFLHDVFRAQSHVAHAAIALGATTPVILLTWVGYFV